MEIQAKALVQLNKWATFAWILLIVPTLIWWKDSILWIALMSIWANIASHFAAWIAARVEHKNEIDLD
jgi:hypothetical protein